LKNPGLVGLQKVVQTDIGAGLLQSWCMGVPFIALIIFLVAKNYCWAFVVESVPVGLGSASVVDWRCHLGVCERDVPLGALLFVGNVLHVGIGGPRLKLVKVRAKNF
jgi:hypothetical protein